MSNAGSGDPLRERIDRLDAEVRSLRMSRRRLVEAADADRRAIERDVHDGVQQDLVALAIDLRRLSGLARRRSGGRQTPRRRAVGQRAAGAATTPPSSRTRSTRRCSKRADSPAPSGPRRTAPASTLVVDVPPGAHYPPEITAAMYWSCVETLSSAASRVRGDRHACSMTSSGADLRDRDRRTRSPEDRVDRLRDRIEALDGRVSVERPNGWGCTCSRVAALAALTLIALGEVEDHRLDALVDRRLPRQSRAS